MSWFLHVERLADWVAWLAWAEVVHFAVQTVLAFRIVMRRRSTGETLAWITLIFAVPIVGVLAYLLLGELRLGRRREQRFLELSKPVRQWLTALPCREQIDWSSHGAELESLAVMCQKTVGVAAQGGNRVTLLPSWQEVFARLIADIDAATLTCSLEFYIWNDGGEADRVAQALIRAQRRGVKCRVLVDSLGSRRFYRGPVAAEMRAAGVEIVEALPGGLLRLPFVRFDIRLHRKIALIDGRVAYTGSLNMVDPRHFKTDAGFGQWVDAMVRLEGPAVEALEITFLADWFVESNDDLSNLEAQFLADQPPPIGPSIVQVLPSGPGLSPRSIEQILLTAIYSARKEIVLTTPYFVPSESLSMAMIAAARRGVRVVLIAPDKVDSALVRFASAAFRGELLEAGVQIAAFKSGLLHTKSITVDGRFALFGSVNLDPRSFRLNFEITLAIYDCNVVAELRKLQQHYLDGSEMVDLAHHKSRSRIRRAAENFARILGPVL